MQSRLILLTFATLALYGLCTSCAVLDYPMSFFDEETGETVETTVGDALADNSDGIASVVSNTIGGVHPLAGAAAGAAAAALFGRRKKKAQVVAEAPPSDMKAEE